MMDSSLNSSGTAGQDIHATLCTVYLAIPVYVNLQKPGSVAKEPLERRVQVSES